MKIILMLPPVGGMILIIDNKPFFLNSTQIYEVNTNNPSVLLCIICNLKT